VSHGKHKFCFFIFTISKFFPLVSFRFVLLVLTRRREEKKEYYRYISYGGNVCPILYMASQEKKKKKETREKGCAVWGHKRVPISVASNERFKAPRVCGKHTQTTTETRILYYTILALSAFGEALAIYFSRFFFLKRRAKLVIKVGQDSPSGQEKTKHNRVFLIFF
jgi:hypothetical protein